MATLITDRTRRADAERNRAAIIDAALSCLAENPRANMTEIARAAGVGRVTLYGHFSSRSELIDAAAELTIHRAEQQLAPIELAGDGDARQALQLLVESSWRIIDDFHGLLAAAETELGVDRVRQHHEQLLGRVRQLLVRGQSAGQFRGDQPAEWLTSCFFAILHGAASEVRAGRLSDEAAHTLVPATVLALVAPQREP